MKQETNGMPKHLTMPQENRDECGRHISHWLLLLLLLLLLMLMLMLMLLRMLMLMLLLLLLLLLLQDCATPYRQQNR